MMLAGPAVPAADPPFWRYAAKFLAALAAAVVGAGAVILAAVDDDHLTVSEWVGIVLAVLAGVGGPAAVYGVRNATKPPRPPPLPPGPPGDVADRTVMRPPVDGSAAAQRAYPHPPPTQRAAADPWTPPDES